MENYHPRIIDSILKEKLKSKGGVVIDGPKWCGKTTTAMQIAKSILRMDDPIKRENNILMSSINPQYLLDGPTPRLIDEWQIAPKLWDAARYEIDTRGKEGQFILTGSATPTETKEITHSGTGRFTWLTMRTMSLFESGESNGNVSLNSLFENPQNIYGINSIDLNKIAFLICRGGWPHSISMKDKIALLQAPDYYKAVVRTDINRVDGISKNPNRVIRLMRALSRNQGAPVTIATLKKDIALNDASSLDEDTILSYLNALKKIFVIEDMPAWKPNLRSQTAIRTSDTRYFSEPSIATSALGIGPSDLINDLHTMGMMFETLCVRDLRIYAESLNGNVYHYRDKSGLECDAVIHLKNGKYGLVEIKLGGDTYIEEGARSLKRLADKIDVNKMPYPSFSMVLTGVGDFAYKRPDGIFVVPIGCLRN